MPVPITIVVPTRERCDTLLASLRTCVTQDYDELAILVSDNASTDATREVVDSYDDPRIRYVNPGERLGMSDHWEFALSHVEKGYITFLGDDDGIMPGGIEEATAILAPDTADALIWPLSAYYWPRYVDPTLANHLSLAIPRRRRTTKVSGAQTLASSATYRVPHYLLPSPYWGMVHRRAFDRVLARSGTFFHSITPDLYAGAAIASVTDEYLHTTRILTLSGSSQHSNGANQVSGATTTGESSPRTKFLRENQKQFHPEIAYSASIPVLLAEVLLQVRDHVDPDVPVPDVRTIAAAALAHPELLFNPGSRDEIEDALRATARIHDCSSDVEVFIRRAASARRPAILKAGLRNVFGGNPIYACPPTTSDIYDATLVAAGLLDRGASRTGAITTNLRGRVTKVRAAARVARTRFS